jgi:hypothetical protein
MKNLLLKSKKNSTLLAILLTISIGYGQNKTQTFTNTSTFTVPTGVTQIIVEAWGGGGKGGAVSTSGVAAGGGGGGAYAKKVLTVTPGNTYTVNVGIGSTTTVTTTNSDSWFSTNATILAKGGSSVASNDAMGVSGGSSLNCIGDIVISGGNGANGIAGSYGGGGGSSAGLGAIANNATDVNGATAPTGGGKGGDGSSSNASAPNTGITNGSGTPGGGGGGARKDSGTTKNGGTGAKGQVIISWDEPEINLTGNSISIVDGDTSPSTSDWTDYSSANVTTGIITKTYTIENTGTVTLTISNPTITGTHAADYSISTNPGTLSLAAGTSTSFTVSFNPSATGTRSATINIVSNDTDETTYNFNVQGTGILNEINIIGNVSTIADGDLTPVTTDWTDFSTTTITRTYTIQNTGTDILNIGLITISGTNASEFTVTTNPSATLAAGANTTFTITFTPTATGLRTANISIANNDTDENPYDFNIQGTGVSPEINITGAGFTILDGDAIPSTTDWTDFSTQTSRTFTIQNLANMPLTIGTVTFSGTNATEFAVTTAPAPSIVAFGSTTFIITFAPGAATLRTASFSIVNNDNTENPYDFSIQGTGVAQEINIQGNGNSISNNDITPSTNDWTDFGSSSLTRTFTIQNTGTVALTVGAITFTGTNPGDFVVTTPPNSTIGSNSSTTFVVTFTAGTNGTRSAIMNIANNDSNENPYNITLQGTGVLPEINITSQFGTTIIDGDTTPSIYDLTDFGDVSIESGSVTVNFVLQNTGSATLNVGAISFSGTNATDFVVIAAPSATIAAGASSVFKIGFNPTVKGSKTSTMSIANSDSDEAPYNFDLTGLGIQIYLDTDSDGVTDNKDIDDDNDGIIDTKEQVDGLAYTLVNTVQYTFLNETFGAGTTKGLININTPNSTCSYCYEDGYGSVCDPSVTLEDGEYCVNYKITGAVASDPENIHGDLAWYDGLDHTPNDTNGRMAVFNASFAAGTFYELQIDGVIPYVPVSYSFWALNIMRQGNFAGSILPNITVEFLDLSNNLISSFNTGDIGRCSYTATDNTCVTTSWLQYSTTLNLGNITSFIIRLKNNSTGGGGNDLAIDDINIVQNYVDSDGDGVANIFDLDDENDGIPDVEEAGYKSLTNGKSKIDTSSPTTWVDANLNGMHDTIDAAMAGSTYSIPDTDGDLVSNYLDLDSDNDSFFDVDEAGLLNGDGDINGDGKGDLLDTDRDGILDLYDNATGFGTTARAYAQDTDANGTPDYMQLDSNNDGIKDIQMGLYSSLDANNDGKIDGSTDNEKDGILDSFDTNNLVIGSPRDLNRKLFLDFDGRNDYAESIAVLGGLSNATLMAWIDLNSGFSTEGVVVGQDKFQIRITSAKKLEVVVNSTVLTYGTVALNTAQWYHVGAVYGNGSLKLYLNGNLVASTSSSGSIAADTSLLTLGKNPVSGTKYFKGKIDEVRVFNVSLTDAQFQKMVYQEIQDSGSQVRGTIVPKDVSSLPFANVLRYYRMDAYKDDIVDDLTTGTIDTGTGMKMYNHKNIYVQQAPMPFLTERTGSFATAINSTVNDIRGLDAMDQDWSIVHVSHNITETANNTDLGLLVDSAATINMTNDTKIQNDWYLKLDGKIDLVGKSQLVQTTDSDLEVTSSGYIERDQQGQSNTFNYNYWSSPVSSINSTTINHGYTVAGVMKDGTTTTPQNLNWSAGINGSATSPITIASYWIFKFQNLSNAYANWSSVGPNGALLAGQGYTMKGSSAATSSQNYTFVGKPNNGSITSTVSTGNLNLCGNPYASAIDANQFIDDNVASINGTLHFWEHYSTNNTHNTAQYQGGYATYTKVGGTAPVAPAGVSGLGSSSKTAKRFIPAGQGFFVTGSGTGGTITFNNNQRLFVKEDNASSYSLYKNNPNPTVNYDPTFDNSEDSFSEVQLMKIRLGYTSTDNYHREILLGFMNEDATAGLDSGYDALSIETLTNDMYFMHDTTKLNIQGEGFFNANNIYPLGVKNAAEGNVKFTIDNKENFEESQDIFIYDNETQIYHDIKAQDFEIGLPAGTLENRFSLRFTNPSALETNENELQVGITHSQMDNMVNINNELAGVIIKSVSLYNLLGQVVISWDIKNQDQTAMHLPVSGLSTGGYIVKIITDKGNISEKILVK